jgi:OmpA-OmpF porin, OOP family
MKPKPYWAYSILVVSFSAVLTIAPATHAGLTDSIKKLGDKAKKSTADKAAAEAEKAASGKKTEPAKADSAKTGGADSAATGASAGGSAAPGAPASAGAAATKVSTVSTKFDYVPGDSVILIDDFKLDDLGEFPARWRLTEGTFEVAEMDGERWLRCVSADGRVRMKLPGLTVLPEFWTLEFDFYLPEKSGQALTVAAYDRNGEFMWSGEYPQGDNMNFHSGTVFSTTPFEGGAVEGRHHVMFMARGTAIKAYVDRQRMANVPEIPGAPVDLEWRLWAPSHPMITNVRFAAGCRPAKDMLAAGKLVTYGIRFETGSDVVMPESAPVLRQVASYMEANPAVRLKVTGHTDNVGAAASNLDLSKRRAASVAKVLAEQFAVAANRFETDGKGDTQAVASNAKPEGRAMNRRVEFAKL